MKKRILIGVAGFVFVAAAAVVTISTVNANSTPELSDLMSQNLEALTQNEDGNEEDPIISYFIDMKEDCPIIDPLTGRV
jgi:hypothetical protein